MTPPRFLQLMKAFTGLMAVLTAIAGIAQFLSGAPAGGAYFVLVSLVNLAGFALFHSWSRRI